MTGNVCLNLVLLRGSENSAVLRYDQGSLTVVVYSTFCSDIYCDEVSEFPLKKTFIRFFGVKDLSPLRWDSV
jgi:hypothetical protein